MKSQDRQAHWDNVYRSKSPLEVSWFQQKPATSLRMIIETGAAKNSPIIDIGGGASTLVDELMDVGFSELSVLDISPASLEHARQRMGANADNIDWIAADITAFSPPRQYTVWHDRAVFHFLTKEEDRNKYVAALKRSVPVAGHVVMATFAIGGPAKCSGLDIVQYDSEKLLGAFGGGFSLVSEMSETHITPGGNEQKFACFELVRKF